METYYFIFGVAWAASGAFLYSFGRKGDTAEAWGAVLTCIGGLVLWGATCFIAMRQYIDRMKDR